MRKQVKNKKVLQAITIGLAAVITATSIPMDTYAAGNDAPASSDEKNDTNAESSSESSSDAVVTADEVVASGEVATFDTVANAIDAAAGEYADHAQSVDNKTLKAEDADIKSEVAEANDELKSSEYLTDAERNNLNTAIIQAEVAKENIDKLEESLNSKYLQSSDMDNETPKKPRLQFGVERTTEIVGYEDGDPTKPIYNLALDENGRPIIDEGSNVDEDGNPIEQFSYQYDSHGVENRSVQGVYQSGMNEIKDAIKCYENDEDTKAEEHLDKAETYLKAAEGKLSDSEKVMLDAIAQYNAADAAAKEAEAALKDLQENVYSGVYASTEAARGQLEAAKKRAEKLTAISDQYYGLMITYFSKSVGTAVYDENGKLNVKESADAVATLTGKDKQVAEGDYLGDDTYYLGRELLEQLVVYKLESEKATNIVFGAEGLDADGNPNNKNNTKTSDEKKAIIGKDTKGNDIVSDFVDAGSHLQYRENGNNGRKHHIKVTYTDNAGVPQTKYYNMVYKGTNYEGSDVDLTKGICYVAEVTYDSKTKKWSYASYSEESDFLSDYNLTKGYRDAQAAVKKAEDELTKLKNEIECLSGKVATNRDKLDELKVKKERAEAAYEASKKSVQDFRDVYDMLRNEGITRGEDIRNDENTIPGGDDVTGGDDAAGGDAVIDGGDVVVTIPGGAGIDAINLTGITGFNNGQVLGARDIRNNTTNIADGGVPLAGNIQASNNKQKNSVIANKKNTTKIKDNEIPLAEVPNKDNEVTMNWMWLLIIFLLGATGKKMYDEYKKKMEAEEAAKLNK